MEILTRKKALLYTREIWNSLAENGCNRKEENMSLGPYRLKEFANCCPCCEYVLQKMELLEEEFSYAHVNNTFLDNSCELLCPIYWRNIGVKNIRGEKNYCENSYYGLWSISDEGGRKICAEIIVQLCNDELEDL